MRIPSIVLLYCIWCGLPAFGAELVGTWEFVTASEDGKNIPDEAIRDKVMEFTEKTLVFKSIKGDVLKQFSYVVKAEGKPTPIDFTRTNPEPEVKQVDQGIVEVSGDELKLAIKQDGEARPTEFAPGPQLAVFTLKRKK